MEGWEGALCASARDLTGGAEEAGAVWLVGVFCGGMMVGSGFDPCPPIPGGEVRFRSLEWRNQLRETISNLPRTQENDGRNE